MKNAIVKKTNNITKMAIINYYNNKQFNKKIKLKKKKGNKK